MDILVIPNSSNKLQEVKLPKPKDGILQMFLYDEENLTLYEVKRYHDQYRSWFLDNSFSKEGHLNLLTKIDPLFLFIPQIIRFASEQFRTLHDICSTFNSQNSGSDRLDYALSPDIDWSQICNTQELDQELYIRFSEAKTLDWLFGKHERTMIALAKELDANTSKATLISYATDLIDLYLDPQLGKKFKDYVISKLKT